MYEVSLGDDGATLGPLEPWQASEFLAHMDRGRDFVGRYVGLADAVFDLESARAYLQSYADKAAVDTARIHGIRLGGELVGGVIFRTMDVARGTAEAGCWLEPAATGRGLVTRACEVIIDWALGERGLHRVEWQVDTENSSSIAIARRLGMTKEGVLRESFPFRGQRHDIEVWSVLAPEWASRRATGTAPGADA